MLSSFNRSDWSQVEILKFSEISRSQKPPRSPGATSTASRNLLMGEMFPSSLGDFLQGWVPLS